MLKEVRRPDKQKVTFTYDALGRRLSKHFSRTTTHFLWSGNVPLHEWKETFEFNYSTGLYDLGTDDIYLRTNRKKIWINTGNKLE